MAIKASHFRQDVYRLLDQVSSTGEPLGIERIGHLLRITPPRGWTGWCRYRD